MNNKQCGDAVSNRTLATKRRSIIAKNMAEIAELQAPTTLPNNTNTLSTIAQRPRRQVKHKFIKSANINVVEKCETSNDSNEEPNSTALLNSLSPNNKMRLVPMIHRLPINTTKLNLQNVINSGLSESPEMHDNILSNAVLSMENDLDTSIIKEMKTERHNKLSNSKQAIRRGRQLRQTVCPVEPEDSNNALEMNHAGDELATSHRSNIVESILTRGKHFACCLMFICIVLHCDGYYGALCSL